MIIREINSFFIDELNEKFENKLNPEIIVYLSGVLSKFMINNEESQPKYLALIVKEIVENNHNKNDLLLQLGEQSLFFSSFFPSLIYKRNISLNYYFSLGSGAYSSLSNIESNPSKKDIYKTISLDFKQIVNKISFIKKDTSYEMSKLDLIQAWQESENNKYLQILLEKGIIPAFNKKLNDFSS